MQDMIKRIIEADHEARALEEDKARAKSFFFSTEHSSGDFWYIVSF